MKHASLWSHNKRFGMTMYSNNTAKSLWKKVRLRFLSYFSSQMIFFPSTVPPLPAFFCLLCLIPLTLISISHPILNLFLRPLFILSVTRFSSLRSHFFCLFLPSILHYLFPLRLSTFISSVLSSFRSSLRYYFDIFLCFVFVSLYFLHSITMPFFLSFFPTFFFLLSLSFLYLLCLYLSSFFLAVL